MRTRTAALLFSTSVLLAGPGALAADPPPAAPAASAAPAAPAAPADPSSAAPLAPLGELPPLVLDAKLKLRLELHGALYLWFYQPLAQTEDPHAGAKAPGTADHFFEIYVATFEVGVKMGDFGLYVNPRFRDTRSRDFFMSNVWLQQGYASYDAPHALLKLGKIENQLSRQGDETFYLNTLYFDGIKYETDYGLSAEGSFYWQNGLGLSYVAQYFLADGRTNGSLRDRETVWVTGAKRTHIGVLRVEPSYRINKDASLRLGLAGQAFHVDLGDGTSGVVVRGDADLSFAYGPVRAFGEGLFQIGQSVNAYPFPATPAQGATPAIPGRASTHNYYLLAGAAGRIWRFTPRYAFSLVRYADLGVTETIHVPGVTFAAHDNVSVLLEYAYWPRKDPSRSWLLDSSFNLLVQGKF